MKGTDEDHHIMMDEFFFSGQEGHENTIEMKHIGTIITSSSIPSITSFDRWKRPNNKNHRIDSMMDDGNDG